MLRGTGVSVGIGFANALIWQPSIPMDFATLSLITPQEESARLDAAISTILEKTNLLRHKIARRFGEEEAIIFDAYSLMLKDQEALLTPIQNIIHHGSVTAEYAAHFQFCELAQQFSQMNNEYLRQRAEDLYNLRDQVLRELMGLPDAEAQHLDRPTIIVAPTLSPADLANIDISRLEGIICESGGYSSHTAIIARTIGIPAVTNAERATQLIRDSMMVALDGQSGEIWLRPDQAEVYLLGKRAQVIRHKYQNAQLFRGHPTVTKDGRRIELSANAHQLNEVQAAIAADAESIGIYRTEKMLLKYKNIPTEEEQFESYRHILEKLGGKSVTIRTFDDGNNPIQTELNCHSIHNPVLGYRGIRMSLGRPSFFRTQLRALLRASAYGTIKIIFPMVSSLEELLDAKSALHSIQQELTRENLPFDENIPIGVLVGIPAAAIISDALAPHVDFFSINYNDLIQFTLAIDRKSPALASIHQQYHPAVLKLIHKTVQSAHNYKISCNLCGEAPGIEQTFPLLLGLGLDGFSLNPRLILSARQILNQCNYEKCMQLANNALQDHTSAQVIQRLTEL